MYHLKKYIRQFIFENTTNLNPNFQKWFSNSKAIDDSGKPLVLYHGTNSTFDKFDINKVGYTTGNYGHYGYGFYFSTDTIEAKTYGDNIIKCYLSIQKPFTATKDQIVLLKKSGMDNIDDLIIKNIDIDSLLNQIKNIDKPAYELGMLIKEFGYTEGWEKYFEKYHVKSSKFDLNDISDVLNFTTLNPNSNGVPDYIFEYLKKIGVDLDSLKMNQDFEIEQSLHWITDLGNRSKEFTEIIKKLGFDGIIYGTEYVVLHPNQIKSINNDGTWDLNDNNIFS